MSSGDDDWGLDAVVRSCTTTTTSFPIKQPPSPPPRFPSPLPVSPPGGGGGGETATTTTTTTTTVVHELQDLCNSFFSKPQHPPKPKTISKRRKNQQKKQVCHVPADGLGSDVWAWRKYGQKPIKGSPYPRGYYRCSSSKGCMARKQVERSRGDPGVLVVTYTAEHNHPAPTQRNSLAGSTRSKVSSMAGAAPESQGGGPLASPTTPLTVDMEEEEEEELVVEDMELVGDDEVLFLAVDGER